MSNKLWTFFQNSNHPIIHKWHHYFEIYERHFGPYREQNPIHMLEIGVYKGGSLEMWSDYFGKDKSFIYGIDIDPTCKRFENDNTKVFIGDQADKIFISQVCSQVPPLDIVLDDGGHTMNQQISTFEAIFDHIKPGGVYMCEDLHTSYWPAYDGGYRKPDTFIEYIKNYIDKLNAYWSQDPNLKPDKYTTGMNSIHFYDSIVVIEKAKTPRQLPIDSMVGTE